MRTTILLVLLAATARPAAAQARVDLLYGFERNVESPNAEYDGWLSAVVEWEVRPGLGVGVGSDHRFEGGSPAPGEHESWAIFASATQSLGFGAFEPYVRVGIGLGPAPCTGDTCGDGIYLRGAGGLRAPRAGPLGLAAEIAVTRVGRPAAGVGLSFRPGS